LGYCNPGELEQYVTEGMLDEESLKEYNQLIHLDANPIYSNTISNENTVSKFMQRGQRPLFYLNNLKEVFPDYYAENENILFVVADIEQRLKENYYHITS
jgi:hypothetical protein